MAKNTVETDEKNEREEPSEGRPRKNNKVLAMQDVSITFWSSDGMMVTRNLSANEQIEIANTPQNKETLQPFLERNHIKIL